jgi:hypothetical protein
MARTLFWRSGWLLACPVSPIWAEVIDYPDDPLRTFPTSDPYVRRVEFGDTGLLTYLINDAASVVIVLTSPGSG